MLPVGHYTSGPAGYHVSVEPHRKVQRGQLLSLNQVNAVVKCLHALSSLNILPFCTHWSNPTAGLLHAMHTKQKNECCRNQESTRCTPVSGPPAPYLSDIMWVVCGCMVISGPPAGPVVI